MNKTILALAVGLLALRPASRQPARERHVSFVPRAEAAQSSKLGDLTPFRNIVVDVSALDRQGRPCRRQDAHQGSRDPVGRSGSRFEAARGGRLAHRRQGDRPRARSRFAQALPTPPNASRRSRICCPSWIRREILTPRRVAFETRAGIVDGGTTRRRRRPNGSEEAWISITRAGHRREARFRKSRSASGSSRSSRRRSARPAATP